MRFTRTPPFFSFQAPAHTAIGNVRTASVTDQNKAVILKTTAGIIQTRVNAELPAPLRKADVAGKIPWQTILTGCWGSARLKVLDLLGTTRLEIELVCCQLTNEM